MDICNPFTCLHILQQNLLKQIREGCDETGSVFLFLCITNTLDTFIVHPYFSQNISEPNIKTK